MAHGGQRDRGDHALWRRLRRRAVALVPGSGGARVLVVARRGDGRLLLRRVRVLRAWPRAGWRGLRTVLSKYVCVREHGCVRVCVRVE